MRLTGDAFRAAVVACQILALTDAVPLPCPVRRRAAAACARRGLVYPDDGPLGSGAGRPRGPCSGMRAW
jgi:hypothetical protein